MIRRNLRRIKRLLMPVRVIGQPSLRCPSLRLGTEYGGWTINPALLDPSSIVYSAGVGEDISFDLALIERFGTTIHAFDPTPRSLAWLKSQRLPPSFVIHGYGLAKTEGDLTFNTPKNPAHVSLSILDNHSTSQITLPVRKLGSVMKELGHSHLDLLKMDIEGSEYGVIEDLVASAIPIRQLLVEYHHRFASVGASHTEDSIKLLEDSGFRLFNISESGEEYSFLRTQFP